MNSDNWLFEPHFEYEYKSYQIRGFTQNVLERFESWQLYPYIDQLNKQLQLIKTFFSYRNSLEEGYQGAAESMSVGRLKIDRESFPDDIRALSTIDEILSLADKEFSDCSLLGKFQLEIAKDQIHIEPLGLYSPEIRGGLLLFQMRGMARAYTYEYRMVRRPHRVNVHKDVRTSFVAEVPVSQHTTRNQIRWNLIRKHKDIPATNSYFVEVSHDLPHFETVLPIVKNYLIEQSDSL